MRPFIPRSAASAAVAVLVAGLVDGGLATTAHAAPTQPEGSSRAAERLTAPFVTLNTPSDFVALTEITAEGNLRMINGHKSFDEAASKSLVFSFPVAGTSGTIEGTGDLAGRCLTSRPGTSSLPTMSPCDGSSDQTMTATYRSDPGGGSPALGVREGVFFTFANGQYLSENRGAGNLMVLSPRWAANSIVTAPTATIVPSGELSADASSVSYSVVVTNTGSVALSDLELTDDRSTGLSCPATSLAPGESMTCASKTPHAPTGADITAGVVQNAVSLTATALPSGAYELGPVPVSVSLPQRNPSVALRAQGRVDGAVVAGSAVTFTATVTNDGPLDLTGLRPTDDLSTSFTCRSEALAVAESTTCTSSHALTQAEVDAGTVHDVIRVSASSSNGTASAQRAVDVPFVAAGSATLRSVSNATASTSLGDEVTYASTITNTGAATLTDLDVTESLGTDTRLDTTTLSPGAQATATSTHRVTQADVDRGSLVDVVSATARAHGSAIAIAQVTVTDALSQSASAVLGLVSDAGTEISLGQTVTYTSTVTNAGTVTLTGITVTESLGVGTSLDTTSLAPGETATATSSHRVTQSDIDRGSFSNRVIASAVDPSGAAVSIEPRTVTDSSSAAPAATLSSVSDATVTTGAGDSVTYTSTVTNTGNVTLSDLALRESSARDTVLDRTTLAPGEQAHATSTYIVDQADVDDGRIENRVTATAKAGDRDVTTSPAVVRNDLRQDGRGAVGIVSDAGADLAAHSTVTYTSTITNVGNITLTDLQISESLGQGTRCSATTLAPGAEVTCTSTHEVTQKEVDAGEFTNEVSASALDPMGDPVTLPTASVTDHVTAAVDATVSLTSDATDVKHVAGTTITYSTTVINTGEITLSGLEGTHSLAVDATCPVDSLAPGESTTCTATTVLTQRQVDEGEVADGVAMVAVSPSGDDVVLPEAHLVDVLIPAPSGTTAIATDPPGSVRSGQDVRYTTTVTNTGNVTLASLTASSALGDDIACRVQKLSPGESTTCVSTHQVTDEDAHQVALVETVAVTADSPGGETVRLPRAAAQHPIETVPESTRNDPIAAVLAFTGAGGLVGPIVAAGVLTAGGLLLGVRRRRRS